MKPRDLKKRIEKAFKDTKNDILQYKKEVKNREKSGRFIQRVSKNIFEEFYHKDSGHLNVIETNFGNEPNNPGEWLLDASITDVSPKLSSLPVYRVFYAIESESQTGWSDFIQDFAKIVHMKADHKLYLQGLNHRTMKGAEDHIERKLAYIKDWFFENECSEG